MAGICGRSDILNAALFGMHGEKQIQNLRKKTMSEILQLLMN